MSLSRRFIGGGSVESTGAMIAIGADTVGSDKGIFGTGLMVADEGGSPFCVTSSGGRTGGAAGEGDRLVLRSADRRGILAGLGSGFDWVADEDRGREGADAEADIKSELR